MLDYPQIDISKEKPTPFLEVLSSLELSSKELVKLFSIGESIAIEYDYDESYIINYKSFSDQINLENINVNELLSSKKALWTKRVFKKYVKSKGLSSELYFLKVIYVITHNNQNFMIQEIPKGEGGTYIIILSDVSHLSLRDNNVSVMNLITGEYHKNINKEVGDSYQNTGNLNDVERDILRLSCSGMRAGGMAKMLNKSEETIKTYKKNVLRKLGARNMFEAIRLYKMS